MEKQVSSRLKVSSGPKIFFSDALKNMYKMLHFMTLGLFPFEDTKGTGRDYPRAT